MSNSIVNNSSAGFLLAPAGRTFKKDNWEDAMKIVLAILGIAYYLFIAVTLICAMLLGTLMERKLRKNQEKGGKEE